MLRNEIKLIEAIVKAKVKLRAQRGNLNFVSLRGA